MQADADPIDTHTTRHTFFLSLVFFSLLLFPSFLNFLSMKIITTTRGKLAFKKTLLESLPYVMHPAVVSEKIRPFFSVKEMDKTSKKWKK
jgi:hypothetical protein